MPKNHYEILGVSRDATPEEIRAAHQHRSQSFAAHPEARQRLDEAVATLADDRQRLAYDRSLFRQTDVLPIAELKMGRQPGAARLPGSAYLILAASAVVTGYLLFGRAPAPSPSNKSPQPITRSAPPAPAEAPAPASVDTFVPILPPRISPATTADAATEKPKFVRPPKKPGFDAAHLAWSVYVVIGAKARGSGVMLEKDKLLTNCHVISGSYQPRSVVVINSATGETFYPEKVANLNEPDDICLLEVPGAPEYIAEWGNSRTLPVAAVTHTISFPGNQGLTLTTGQLMRRETIKGLAFLLTSNRCAPGVSGGPLFDDEGRVIGITTGGRRYQLRSGEIIQGECISVESETAREVMWRVMVPIAFGPFNYQGALGGGK